MRKNKSVIVENGNIEAENKKINVDFQFFKNCSATLKKFSLIMFVVNLFVTLVAAVVGLFLIYVYIGAQMMSLLLAPIICVGVIAVLVARLVSALIYGFAEIVEKYENK